MVTMISLGCGPSRSSAPPWSPRRCWAKPWTRRGSQLRSRKLPSGVKRKFYETMAASPPDLLDAVEGKLTLDEQYATEYWLKGLPRAYKRVLMG